MRIRELVNEADVPGSPTQDPSKTVTSVDPNADSGQKVQQLTAAMSGLQKQIQTLQKAALQQASTPATPAAVPTATAPAPGTTAQPNIPKGTVGPSTQPAPTGTAPATTTLPGQKPGLGQPSGVPMGQAPAPGGVSQPATPPAAVSQPPQIVKSKIQQDLQKQITK